MTVTDSTTVPTSAEKPLHIAIITAGGAGMFCGSCMHDNTWARALHHHGQTVSLMPTYTPIRVDEENQSEQKVYLGGINLYLEHRSKLWKKIPRLFTRWLDSSWILNLATKFGVSNDAKELGELTLAMLSGEAGPQHREIEELADVLATQMKPDVVCFSNALLVGTLRTIKQRFSGPVFCLLQGDDIFLEQLAPKYREQSLRMISERAQQFDGFITHSRYYQSFMEEYLNLPGEKFHQLPLGIDLEGHDGLPKAADSEIFTIGYFARICPEKGLHNLIQAFEKLHAKHPRTKLKVGGYLGKRDATYFKDLQQAVVSLGEAFEYVGSPDSHEEKVAFLKSVDVLSVPTDYREPKGLSILEALANGVPVVQPDHGSFPELLELTRGGLLFEPGDTNQLADRLEQLLLDAELRQGLAAAGHENVRLHFGPEAMCARSLEIFRSVLSGSALPPEPQHAQQEQHAESDGNPERRPENCGRVEH